MFKVALEAIQLGLNRFTAIFPSLSFPSFASSTSSLFLYVNWAAREWLMLSVLLKITLFLKDERKAAEFPGTPEKCHSITSSLSCGISSFAKVPKYICC